MHRGHAIYVEVCDPVNNYSFDLPGADGTSINVQDFVTPAWYRPGSHGPFDLKRKLSAPLQLGDGGYFSRWPETKEGRHVPQARGRQA